MILDEPAGPRVRAEMTPTSNDPWLFPGWDLTIYRGDEAVWRGWARTSIGGFVKALRMRRRFARGRQ